MTSPHTLTAPPVAPERVTPEVVSPMKPSEALRLGRLIYPVQAFGGLGSGIARCALGAIWAAMPMYEAWQDVESRCPRRGRFLRCGLSAAAVAIVLHLNDDHHWSDDQIVAWLESLGL